MTMRNEPYLVPGVPKGRFGRRDVLLRDRTAVVGYDPAFGQGWGTPSYTATEGERNPKDIFTALWHNKSVIGLVTIVCAVAAIAISALLPPRYTAQGMLTLSNPPVYMPQLGVQLPPTPPDMALARSQAQILTSRSVLESVARTLKLDENPDLNPYLQDPDP
jgi:uncharacterized protein involved in exopolysaccharide biosynthesis